MALSYLHGETQAPSLALKALQEQIPPFLFSLIVQDLQTLILFLGQIVSLLHQECRPLCPQSGGFSV